MRKLLSICFILLGFARLSHGAACGSTAFNPFTGKLDCVGTVISSNTAISVKSITFPDGTVQVSSPTAGGSAPGSTGDVPFNNGGSFGADHTNFFWDNTNKFLGLGTNSPSKKLDISESGLSGGMAFHYTNTAASYSSFSGFDFIGANGEVGGLTAAGIHYPGIGILPNSAFTAIFSAEGPLVFFTRGEFDGGSFAGDIIFGTGQAGYLSTNEKLRISVGGPVSINKSAGQTVPNTNLIIFSTDTTWVPLTVQEAASQTADLQDWKNSSANVLADISSSGHINSTSVAAATVTSCGTAPSLTGSDNAGTITVGSGVSVTGCTLTFGTAYTNAPSCVISDNSVAINGDISSVNNSSVTFGFSASLGGGKVYYICMGRD
jgi:hypothetical protein